MTSPSEHFRYIYFPFAESLVNRLRVAFRVPEFPERNAYTAPPLPVVSVQLVKVTVVRLIISAADREIQIAPPLPEEEQFVKVTLVSVGVTDESVTVNTEPFPDDVIFVKLEF